LTGLREATAILNWHLGRARYIFVHIPKNAGVSIRKSSELKGLLISADPYFHKSGAYTRELAKTMEDAGEHHGFQHARWRDLNPKVTRRLKAVGVVRNPWARTVSRWRFEQLAVRQGKISASEAAETFEEFLEQRNVWGGKDYYWHRAIRGWYPQADYATDEEGKLRVELLRFEHLASDATQYFSLNHPIGKRNRTSRTPFQYQEAYTPKTVQIVADWYQKDIDFFGFDFDTTATRNAVFS
jgi:hypothetical protein